MITDINSEDRLVQQTLAKHLENVLGWESIYAHNTETFGPSGTLGRLSDREVVLVRDLRAALERLNPDLPAEAREQAVERLTRIDFARSRVQHNREFDDFIRTGVPVQWRDAAGETRYARARVIDFGNRIGPDGKPNNRFLAVRELKIQGVRVPHYNRRADLICFVNGLPLVFIELKAVYRNIRAGFDNNLTDYLSEHGIAHAFRHNAFLVVSNGDQARYGSITSKWGHFVEWKRNAERDQGRVDAEALLDSMLGKERLLDLVESFILLDDSRAGGTRKIVAGNHQVLGVNNAVASVLRQEELKRRFPPEERIAEFRVPRQELLQIADAPAADLDPGRLVAAKRKVGDDLPLLKRAYPDLGRLGVFWHTLGSGKSYSMAFFAEKVRRVVPGNFTFLVMTDREDLDDQIWRTFIGCGVADEKTPRASSGKDYEVITADDRLDKLAADFVEHCTTRWQSGKSMLVCIDKVTCARMFQRIEPRWRAKLAELKAIIPTLEGEITASADPDARERLAKQLDELRGRAQWMERPNVATRSWRAPCSSASRPC
jgi:type I restriction enzyme R subunit